MGDLSSLPLIVLVTVSFFSRLSLCVVLVILYCPQFSWLPSSDRQRERFHSTSPLLPLSALYPQQPSCPRKQIERETKREREHKREKEGKPHCSFPRLSSYNIKRYCFPLFLFLSFFYTHCGTYIFIASNGIKLFCLKRKSS